MPLDLPLRRQREWDRKRYQVTASAGIHSNRINNTNCKHIVQFYLRRNLIKISLMKIGEKMKFFPCRRNEIASFWKPFFAFHTNNN